jgi:hypothetical protein
MKCLRIPLSRTRLEPPRVACWDALIMLRGCVFPNVSDFLLRQKRGCKAIGRWYRSIPSYQSAQRATADEGRQIGSPTRPSIVSLIVTVRIGPGRRMWRTLPAPADRAIRVQASVDANRPKHVFSPGLAHLTFSEARASLGKFAPPVRGRNGVESDIHRSDVSHSGGRKTHNGDQSTWRDSTSVCRECALIVNGENSL